MLLLALAFATPTDQWLERHPRVRADWIEAQDTFTRDWVNDDGVLERVETWLAQHRQQREPSTLLHDRRDGTSLWVERRFIEDKDDPRLSEWTQTVLVQHDGDAAPYPIEAGDPTRPFCLTALSPAGHALIGRIVPPEPGSKLSKPTDCDILDIDLADGTSRPLVSGRWPTVTATPEGHTWSQTGKRRATVIHQDAAGIEVDRFRWRRRALVSRPDGTVAAWRKGKVWTGVDPLHLERLLKSPSAVRILQVDDDQVVALSTDRANGGEVVRIRADDPSKEAWRSLVAERPGSDLYTASLHADHVFTVWSRDGAVHLEVQPYRGGPSRPIDLGGPWTHISLSRAWSDDDVMVKAHSPAGRRNWSLHMEDGEPRLTLLHDDPHEGVVMRTVVLPTPDGDVAVTLLHQPEATPDGTGALWLYTYGGFGHSVRPHLLDSHELFLAAGGTVGFIHPRGGRERGEDWHLDATLENLPRTIDDVDAAVAGLLELGWAAPGRVALQGASNGGLTVTAAVARTPDNYGAVVAYAGVYDMLNGPRWPGHWWPREYGKPRGDMRPVLQALSPRQNPPSRLPPTLIVTGAHDPTVPPRHSYALAAAWDEVPGGPLLLRVDGHGTHGGRKRDRDDMVRSDYRGAEADTAAFLFRALGLEVPEPSPPAPSP